jgi:hypothetical protein
MRDRELASIFYMWISSTFVEETFFSQMYAFGTFVENEVPVAPLVYFYSIPLVIVSVFRPVQCCFYNSGFVV